MIAILWQAEDRGSVAGLRSPQSDDEAAMTIKAVLTVDHVKIRLTQEELNDLVTVAEALGKS